MGTNGEGEGLGRGSGRDTSGQLYWGLGLGLGGAISKKTQMHIEKHATILGTISERSGELS